MPTRALSGAAGKLLPAVFSAASICSALLLAAPAASLAAAPVATDVVTPSVQPADNEAVRNEINVMRSNPPAYAAKLRAYRAFIGPDKIWRHPSRPVGVITHEGTAAVDEAIAVLEAASPLPPLADDPRLAAAALAHAVEQSRTGAIGHDSADGPTMGARIKRGLVFYGSLAETISYGQNTPDDVVRQLLVDDNVPSRGHRKILLLAELHFVGVGCATHPVYRFSCVQDYSSIALPK